MSLWQIAARNVWQNRGRYLSYLGSAAFSVTVFFLYMALAHHPAMATGGLTSVVVAKGMQATAVVIAIFTFLFLLYSSAAFVRSRMKEFGLLSLLGVSRRQLTTIFLWESLIVALMALGTGLSLGLLFLKLFFMVISALLNLPYQLPFYAGFLVWRDTLTVFGAFFLVVALASLRGVLGRNVVELLRAGRQPKANPTFSGWKAALGLILVIGGYAWAASPNRTAVAWGIVPVTAMVSLGTFLLMREGSIALLAWLHRRERIFYRTGPFLTVSQLMFKLQDNYRILSAVSLLVAVILTAVGTVAAGFTAIMANAAVAGPQAVQVVVTDPATLQLVTADVDAALYRFGVTGLTPQQLVTGRTKLVQREATVTLVPYSFYQVIYRPKGQPLAVPREGEAILVYPDYAEPGARKPAFDDQVKVSGQEVRLHILPDQAGPILNAGWNDPFTLVLPDAFWKALVARVPETERVGIAAWNGKNPRGKGMAEAVAALRSAYGGGADIVLRTDAAPPAVELTSTVQLYQSGISSLGLTLFVGAFVSLVFFAATCSLLYFRLFTEIDEDRKYFRRLRQLGASGGELKRLAQGQTLVIFLVPFVAGVFHATFAMVALGTLIKHPVLQIGWMVALAYLALYFVYLYAIMTFYWRSLQAGLGGRQMA